ncbi:MAG TPA: hydroxymethylglutaryl-CoA lyase [Candidatus Binatia bacterium]|nr:hydroxymethylglutaryl-CoA lyase [Candidatus Binatia bacterium]
MPATPAKDAVRVVEVGPRDGLQNEPGIVPAAVRIALIERLAAAGVRTLEVGSFVSPRWVPQMADTDAVLAGLGALPELRAIVLVPNDQGLDRALAAGVREVAVFTAASDAFNRRNINAGVDESLARLAPVVQRAREQGLRVRGYVSTVLGCPYQGEVALAEVVRVTAALVEMGCQEISLGDTIGTGTPAKARAMYRACAGVAGAAELAVHFHDTRGQALANVYACLEEGARIVDASVAGLGGCPYANGASGNLATEDLVYMLHGLGMDTGIDLDALTDTARWISAQLGREPASRLGRIGRNSAT